jgi:modulator of drug activity B
MINQKRILLIHTHQKYDGVSEGKLNKTLAGHAKSFFEGKRFEVQETFIDNGYEPQAEVEKHLNADLVIIQTPVFWFNTPWIYKKYADEVFMEGLLSQKMLDDDGRSRNDVTKQYGSGGNLDGKKVMVSATWNAPIESFDNQSQVFLNGKSANDVLFNVTLNYKFCGYDVLPNFHCFDVVKNPTIDLYMEEYNTHLEMISKMINDEN